MNHRDTELIFKKRRITAQGKLSRPRSTDRTLLGVSVYLLEKKFDDDGNCIKCGRAGVTGGPDLYVPDCDQCDGMHKAEPDPEVEKLRVLVTDFANEIIEKLTQSYLNKHRTGWDDPGWSLDDIERTLIGHVAKGDMRDVAAFAAFLWYHKEVLGK